MVQRFNKWQGETKSICSHMYQICCSDKNYDATV